MATRGLEQAIAQFVSGRRSARPLVVVATLLSWDCGAPAVAPVRGNLQGGVLARPCDWPAIVRVGDVCSGVVLNSRAVVYAGHCGANIRAVRWSGADGVDVDYDPVYCDASLYATSQADLAFCILEKDIPAPVPVPLLECEIGSLTPGMAVVVVALGSDGTTQSLLDKRMVTGRLEKYGADQVVVEGIDGVTCSGDSGGAVLARIGQVWRTIAIVSAGDAPTCDDARFEGVPIWRWSGYIEERTRLRLSPCAEGGRWAPTLACGIGAVDSSQDLCRAGVLSSVPNASCGAPFDPTRLVDGPPSLEVAYTHDLEDAEYSAINVSAKVTAAWGIKSVRTVLTTSLGGHRETYLQLPPFNTTFTGVPAGNTRISVTATDLRDASVVSEWRESIGARSDQGCMLGGTGEQDLWAVWIACLALWGLVRERAAGRTAS